MLKSFLETIIKYNMLTYGDRIIAGVSGGADSILLLALLAELREGYALNITAAHINHGIRGAEADTDEAFVRAYCVKIGVDFIPFHEDVPKAAKTLKLSIEEAGREIRYKCFEKAMKSYNANKIAVAHNRNDNAETVFMRICRGTGLAGLCGIPAVRGPIIRPLIETGRTEIESYLAAHCIPFRTDSTNLSDTHMRNCIRNTLIPAIESALGVDICEKLNSLSLLCAMDEEFLDKTAAEAFTASILSRRGQGISLSISALKAYHPAAATRVIRLALAEWGLKDISVYHIQAIQALITAQSGKQARLPGSILVQKHHNELRFSIKETGKPHHFRYGLKPEIPLYVPELSRYYLLSENGAPGNSMCTKAFIYGKITDIQIRSRQPGDFIRIRHIGTVKLKDYFINNKIPSYLRDVCGLAAQGNEILWIMDNKDICNEHYEALNGELQKIFIHVWE